MKNANEISRLRRLSPGQLKTHALARRVAIHHYLHRVLCEADVELFQELPFVARLNQYKYRETIAAVPRYRHERVQIGGSLDNARRSVNTTSDIAAYSAGGPFGPPKRQDKA